jgi:hypothetical protein
MRNVIPEVGLEEVMDEAEEHDTQTPAPAPPTPGPTAPEPPAPAPPTDRDGALKDYLKELLARDSSRFKKLAAGGIAAAIICALSATGGAWWAASQLGQEQTDEATVVQTDAEMLEMLQQQHRVGASGTTLGRAAASVYEYDDDLRDSHLLELQKSYDESP